jgi:hypothetical protein
MKLIASGYCGALAFAVNIPNGAAGMYRWPVREKFASGGRVE